MWCDPPSVISADIIQPSQTSWTMAFSSTINDKQQLSFIYQPGVGLYDKKIDMDQDLRITSTITDVDERIQSFELSPSSSSTFTSDVDHRWSSSSSSSIESPSRNIKTNNLYKSYLRRQNEQDSLPIREKLFSSDDILSDKTKKNPSTNNTNYHMKSIDVNITTNQENNQKRKFDQNVYTNKKLRHSSSSIIKNHLQSNEQKQCEIFSKSSNSDISIDENFKCEKNLLDEELDHQKTKLITIEEKRSKQQLSAIKLRSNSNERIQKQSITTIIKNIPMVKKSSSENPKSDIISTEKEILPILSQGLLLCPKEEPIKKKKKKKIASTIISNTESLDDDYVLDSILFNEMQSVQQQWSQFLILTMEKELHINPSDGKKKLKQNKFNRTNEFVLSHDSLYDFEGMKHWCPTSR